jgi:phenylacetate-coenzyme A ligase PaaK-like adenylate-forming protein
VSDLLKNENSIFLLRDHNDFVNTALQIFRLQYSDNKVYREWVDGLKVHPDKVSSLEQIPFLPIEFFKKFVVSTSRVTDHTLVFTSSGTTSAQVSKHYVADPSLYERSFLNGFKLFYGDPEDYCILALLPSYLERKGSSLVYMCDQLIGLSKHPESGFFLHDTDHLILTLLQLKATKQKTLLIGVSYALMDLCDLGVQLDDNFIVMETGGMKGTRKELLKAELHNYLKKGLGIKTVHSEYGMTEMLSQAYSSGDGIFKSPPWLKFMTREIDDPMRMRTDERTGGINVIDLANIHSCSFIATSDLGRIYGNGTLELMGRYNDSDVRGCNLMLDSF